MDLFSEQNLTDKFIEVYSSRYSYTPTRRQKIDAYRSSLGKNISRLAKSLDQRSYLPAYKGILIEKEALDGGKKFRGITPLCVDDLIVQKVVKEAIDGLLQPHIATKCSYGRKKTGAEQPRCPVSCCKDIAAVRKGRAAFRTDLIRYFPSISRDKLIDNLVQILTDDDKCLPVLKTIINTDAVAPQNASDEQKEQFWPKGKGVHQGTVLAPMFANLYMTSWDRRWEGKVDVFRYIDDWLVIGEAGQDLNALVQEMIVTLPSGVSCHAPDSDKSHLYESDTTIEFVGLLVTASGNVRPSEKAMDSFKKTVIQRLNAGSSVLDLFVSVSRFRSAWLQYYRSAGITANRIDEANKYVDNQLAQFLTTKQDVKSSTTAREFVRIMGKCEPDVREISKAIRRNVSEGNIHPDDIAESIAQLA